VLSRSRLSLVVAGLLAVAASTTLPATATERRTIDSTHADVIALYLDDDTLVAATRADVPEVAGTRLDPGCSAVPDDPQQPEVLKPVRSRKGDGSGPADGVGLLRGL
jgi:hypothetical protein